MNHAADRRQAPRTRTRLLVRHIRREEEPDQKRASFFCETRNISRNGAYCVCSRSFPEFSRIRITVELKDLESGVTEDFDCEGVVVRSDGKTVIDGKEVYSFAVFFDRMSEDDRQRIDRYVTQHRAG